MTKKTASEIITLRAKERGKTLKDISEEIGRNHAYIQQFINRGSPRVLPQDVREALAETLGGHPDDYRDRTIAEVAPRPDDRTEYISLPVYDIQAAAGFDDHPIQDPPTVFQPFLKSQASRWSNAHPDRLAVIVVRGDSMVPTFTDGDFIVVDFDQTTVKLPGIYLLAMGQDMFIKRCERDYGTGMIMMQSDNPKYTKMSATLGDDLRVIGRALFSGQSIG